MTERRLAPSERQLAGASIGSDRLEEVEATGSILPHECVVDGTGVLGPCVELVRAQAAYEREFALEKVVLMLGSGFSVQKANMWTAVMPRVAVLRMGFQTVQSRHDAAVLWAAEHGLSEGAP